MANGSHNTSFNDVLEWNVIDFLFRIQYLKHKGEVELFELKYGRS